VRSVNEDSFLATPYLFAVADGMGGHAAGEVASQIAIGELARLDTTAPLTLSDLFASLDAANLQIVHDANESPDQAGMGTTLVGLAIVTLAGQEHWQVFNIGDSRLYRIDDESMSQITIDHSEAEEMVALGRLTRDEARTYDRKNVVTRSLGTESPPLADSWMFPPSSPERFLICSDGLTNELGDDEIEAILRAEFEPHRAATALVDRAVDAGGRDNITVIVVNGAPAANQISAEEDTRPRRSHDH
jgi:protein phosphatase